MRGGAKKSAGAGAVNAVQRTMAVLECLSARKRMSLDELSRGTGLAKPTALRFLSTLRSLGYVFRDEGDAYFLGLKTFMVGSRALDHIDLIEVARPAAERLSALLGEAVHLGMLDEDHAVYVLKVEAKATLRMYSRVGRQIPLHCTSIGKVLLAGMGDPELSAVAERLDLAPFTPKTLRTPQALAAEVSEIRKRGYAMDDEEHEAGIHCVAMPVRDHAGATVAAMSVSWPTFRYERQKEPAYLEAIRAATAEISAILGGPGA
jgi:IclR family transcriptional regulator, KDG regulon repressor